MEETVSSASDRCLYLYGVVRSIPLELNRISGIEEASPPFLIPCGELACIVSVVSGREYETSGSGDEDQRTNWIATHAVRHDQILRRIHQLTTVVPFKFGTLSSDKEQLADILREHEEKLHRALDLFSGKEEWVVRLAWQLESAISVLVVRSSGLPGLNDNANGGSPGEQYFLAKRRRKIVEGMAATEAASIHALSAEGLKSLHVDLAPLPLKDGPRGHPQNIFAAAMLVEEARVPLVLEHLREIESRYSAFHVSAELSGPWPPYSFIPPIASKGATSK